MTTGRTPEAVVGRLEAEMKKILSQPDTIAAFDKLGFPVSFLGARDCAAFIDEEIERWAVAVKASGATAD
ncbi:MAG: hypothetical protein HYU75_09760 [Betaproteobacteria bacterium]|nr:hypothetical protein [Betaproteobacteria bacterium]